MRHVSRPGARLGRANGKGNCVTCHAGFNFTDESYHTLGVGMLAKKPDLGRATVSKARSETGAFKTPTLRNATQSAPYMRDGSEATIADVVRVLRPGRQPKQVHLQGDRPLGLAEGERADGWLS